MQKKNESTPLGCLTLSVPMDCSIEVDTVRSGWSIVYNILKGHML